MKIASATSLVLLASGVAAILPPGVTEINTGALDPKRPLQRRQIVDPDNPFVNPEDPQCLYYCYTVTPVDPGMAPIDEVHALADYLETMPGNCAISRPPGSTEPAFTRLLSTGNSEVNIFFNEKVTTAYYAEYPCNEFAVFVRAMVDVCGPQNDNERVYAQTDVPNCRHIEGTLQWQGEKPGTYPGIRIEIARFGAHDGA
ncbi:hypothetical protein CC78DRAFT_537483 [Lojkania enalia]|uniref:Uncharacterized protein n=1 Tax=Lojkania enalia TaxID=147567 RepID=A0A9P4JYS8_9PLEO|nr:hypothetical protein CC78DRAFT_537483 [Didymosphaeria enalia]